MNFSAERHGAKSNQHVKTAAKDQVGGNFLSRSVRDCRYPLDKLV
jgi:hypothetical protein